jgi:DNA-binding response OmpR family regulator
MKALLIEDETGTAEAIRLAIELMSDDLECVYRTNGADAEIIIADERPDVVLLDIGLPGEDGISVLRRCREVSEVPVIIISGRSSPADIVRGLQAGADDYLKKPFYAMELMARINAVIRRYRATSDDPISPRTAA